MSGFVTKERAKRRAGKVDSEEPVLTVDQLNAASTEFLKLPEILGEALYRLLNRDDYHKVEPEIPALAVLFKKHISKNFFDAQCEDPYPRTLSDLRERIDSNENTLLEFLETHAVEANEDMAIAFKAAYRQICERLENAATLGQSTVQTEIVLH